MSSVRTTVDAPNVYASMEEGEHVPHSVDTLLDSYRYVAQIEFAQLERCASAGVPFVNHAPRRVYQLSSGMAWGYARAGVEHGTSTMNRSAWCT